MSLLSLSLSLPGMGAHSGWQGEAPSLGAARGSELPATGGWNFGSDQSCQGIPMVTLGCFLVLLGPVCGTSSPRWCLPWSSDPCLSSVGVSELSCL